MSQSHGKRASICPLILQDGKLLGSFPPDIMMALMTDKNPRIKSFLRGIVLPSAVL